jgi:hypothetical protein
MTAGLTNGRVERMYCVVLLTELRMLTLSRFVCAVRKGNTSLARLRSYACDALVDEGDMQAENTSMVLSGSTTH